MDLPDKDVLPPSSEDAVIPPAPAPVPPAPAPAEVLPPAPVVDSTKPPTGFVPYQALNEERGLRKQAADDLALAHARIAELESGNAPSHVISPGESGDLESTVKTLTATVAQMQRAEAIREVTATYPVLAQHLADFEQFLSMKPGYSVLDAAHLFIIERGLNPDSKPRRGVERPTGGDKTTPPRTGWTPEEIDNLRTNQPRKFAQMLRSGEINPDDIK